MLPKVLKNFNLFIDGRGYAGRVEDVTLPKLTIKTEEYQLGGLDTPVQMDMGMDKLECELTLSEYDTDVIKLFDTTSKGQVPLVLRGGVSRESTNANTLADVMPVIINLTGNIIELDFGQWKAGENAPLRIRLALRYYKLNMNSDDLIEIDVDNQLRKINGKDQVSALKNTIGF